MAASIEFDLNAAIRLWREQLSQSPHFRPENLDELESHLRDSVNVLQSKGLAADEAFMVGAHRVGKDAALESEFAAENGGRGWRDMWWRWCHRYGNKVVHGLILFYFTFGCLSLWGYVKLGEAFVRHGKSAIPAPRFTQMVIGWSGYWYVLPLLAMFYCLLVWFRKGGGRSSWFGFFAGTTAMLVLLALPALFATFLPVIDLLTRIPPPTPEVHP